MLRSRFDWVQRRSFLLLTILSASTALVNPPRAAATPTPVAATQGRENLNIDVNAVNKPWKGDLDAMIQRHVIRVLVVPSKTFYFVNKGVERGATYDFVRQFEDDLNKKLARQKKLSHKNLKVKVFFVPVGREGVIAALNAGKGDIAASALTVTDSGRKLVDYSVPVYSGSMRSSWPRQVQTAISTIEDLSGTGRLRAPVLQLPRESAGPESAPRRAETRPSRHQGRVGKPRGRGPHRDGQRGPDPTDHHQRVRLRSFWKQVFPTITVYDNVAVRKGGDIAWAIRKGSPQLKAAVDDFITRNGQGKAIGNMILARYLKDAKYVKNAASAEDRKKFLAVVGYFQKYGQEYDVDWLLMAAQGYQESRLNQQAKSRVGAIGVMQLMPATGKDMKVGDITQTEANIHAGVKYMRWMIDNYYGNEPMTKLDKALFAFASYNAGAGRISGLRQEAAKRGLNPNVWFHNVEYVAAEKIGAETVTYVANIYKYYIAYRLILDQKAAKAKDATALRRQPQ